MGSRMHREMPVRFQEGSAQTCHSNVIRRRFPTLPEHLVCSKLACNRRRLSKASNREAVEQLLQEKRMLRAQMLRLPAKSQTDKRLKYVRYADDFIIGIKGSKEECEKIKQKIKEFLAVELKLELSEEKTLITHSANYARFLGYDIRVRRNNQITHHPAMAGAHRTGDQ
mgnify:CR=1 FL=1